jgi:hypothetical protein
MPVTSAEYHVMKFEEFFRLRQIAIKALDLERNNRTLDLRSKQIYRNREYVKFHQDYLVRVDKEISRNWNSSVSEINEMKDRYGREKGIGALLAVKAVENRRSGLAKSIQDLPLQELPPKLNPPVEGLGKKAPKKVVESRKPKAIHDPVLSAEMLPAREPFDVFKDRITQLAKLDGSDDYQANIRKVQKFRENTSFRNKVKEALDRIHEQNITNLSEDIEKTKAASERCKADSDVFLSEILPIAVRMQEKKDTKRAMVERHNMQSIDEALKLCRQIAAKDFKTSAKVRFKAIADYHEKQKARDKTSKEALASDPFFSLVIEELLNTL